MPKTHKLDIFGPTQFPEYWISSENTHSTQRFIAIIHCGLLTFISGQPVQTRAIILLRSRVTPGKISKEKLRYRNVWTCKCNNLFRYMKNMFFSKLHLLFKSKFFTRNSSIRNVGDNQIGSIILNHHQIRLLRRCGNQKLF